MAQCLDRMAEDLDPWHVPLRRLVRQSRCQSNRARRAVRRAGARPVLRRLALADAGIAPELLRRTPCPRDRRPVRGAVQVLDRSPRRRVLLGFLWHARWRRGSFALVVRSGGRAKTLELAMPRHAARTFGLLQDEVALEPVRTGSLAGVTVRFRATHRLRSRLPHELLLRALWRLLGLAGRRQVAHRTFRLCLRGLRPMRQLSQDLSRAAAVRAAAAVGAFWSTAGAAAGRRCGGSNRAAGLPGRREVQVSHDPRGDDLTSARVRSRGGEAQPALAPTLPPPPTHCTWRRPRCKGAWRPTEPHSRR